MSRATSQLKGIRPDSDYSVKTLHKEMQSIREGEGHEDLTLKSYLAEVIDPEYTPEKLYSDMGINFKAMTVEKLFTSTENIRWLFPEIMRDAIRLGLTYGPFHPQLVTSNETINSNTLTMPQITFPADVEVQMRITGEGATITEGTLIFGQKGVSLKKRARGLRQTYESIMWTPLNLATLYMEDVGTRLGADLDKELIDIAINGDQADGSEAAPVIGAATAGTLLYTDIARAWIRFHRINRRSSAMLASEADAITILNMQQFLRNTPMPSGPQGNAAAPSGTTLRINTPLPADQDVYVHSSVPAQKIILIDTSRAFVQLTGMPLLIESERIVNKQITGEYASIITGFANVFKDARLILDYATTLVTNPGPVAYA